LAEGRAPSSRRTNDGRGAGFFLRESDMKWIAVKHPDKSKVEIIRIKDVEGFVCESETGDGLKAQSKTVDGAIWDVVNLPPHSPARILLDKLNGPVGEVPYK